MKRLVIFAVMILAGVRAMEDSKAASDKWICTGGVDPNKMSKKDYLTAFGKSPCAPIILLPGIGGSNLQVMIDCPTLKTNHPTIFADCGWNGCPNSDDFKVGMSAPDKEYEIWVPTMLSPMTIFTPTEGSKKCFADLAGAQYNISTNSVTYTPLSGVQVKIVGTTPQTRPKSSWDCAMSGVLNLIPDIPEPHEMTYYEQVYEKLLYLGYISGLTVQAIPYDFRLDSKNDVLNKNFILVIQELYAMINKKIVLLSHSMGSFRTYNLMNQMTQAQKDMYLKQWVAAAPVLVGAPEVNKILLCGDQEYDFALNFGIDFPTFKNSLATFSSMYQLLPNDYLTANAGKPWMQKIQARVAYEKGQSNDPVFDWMPKRDQVCYDKYPDNKYCISGLVRPDNYGSILGNPITDSNLHTVLTQYGFNSLGSNGFKVIDDNFRYLPNIGLPTTIVYGTRVASEGGHNFNQDPRTFTSKNEFCDTKSFQILQENGDGTVPQHASTTPWVKWAWEFEQNVTNAKPVKFVDVCSGLNQRGTPYDTKNSSGEWIMTKNEYQGLECNCSAGKVKDCDHIGIIILQ
jgi:hypothetical protein